MGCLFAKQKEKERKPNHEEFRITDYSPPPFHSGDIFVTFGDAIITNLDETGRIVNKNDN